MLEVLCIWVRTFSLDRVTNERKREGREECRCENIWFMEQEMERVAQSCCKTLHFAALI